MAKIIDDCQVCYGLYVTGDGKGYYDKCDVYQRLKALGLNGRDGICNELEMLIQRMESMDKVNQGKREEK